MNILLTGGAGYIGSHTTVVLLQAGHEVILLDNFCNSKPSVLDSIGAIVGQQPLCIEGDVRNTNLVEKILRQYHIEAVVHFAGFKAVGESVENPIKYYANNVQGMISLLEAMKCADLKTLVFSSSATVYGNPQYLPIDENHPKCATNAYGRSKLHIEEMLKDVANSDEGWRIICLRYFNPVGAHESGLIGESPNGVPNNLMPYIAQVASGKLPYLSIFGDDYHTKDGTGIRDYIHIMDLAEGHLASLNYLKNHKGWEAINLGTGRGTSVLDMISSYQQVSARSIPFKITGRREGDIASCYTNVNKSSELLSWRSRRSLDEMCKSSWAWESGMKNGENKTN